ncbi:MAG: GTP cyclohydrolase I, partial [Candidatus Humimicrobiaceae bacterium]
MDKKLIEEGVRLILKGIGEDLEREGLRDTPGRVADMYEEIFSGINQDPSDVIKSMFDESHDEIIVIKDI